MKKKLTVYAFIDSQNLNLGTSKDIRKGRKIIYHGWKLDYRKFRRYLADKFRVRKAFLFIGFIKQNKNLYKRLKSYLLRPFQKYKVFLIFDKDKLELR